MSDDRPRCEHGHLIRHRVTQPDECRGRNCEFNLRANASQLQLPPDLGESPVIHGAGYTVENFYTGPGPIHLIAFGGVAIAIAAILYFFG